MVLDHGISLLATLLLGPMDMHNWAEDFIYFLNHAAKNDKLLGHGQLNHQSIGATDLLE